MNLRDPIVRCLKASKLYVGDGSVATNVFVCYENDKIAYVGEEKPEGVELLGEYPVITPAFIDAHSHIGMDRAGEPWSEEEANEEMDSILPYLEAQNSVYMDDKAFEESVDWGVLYSVVTHGSGNIIGGKMALLRNWKKLINEAFVKHVGVKAALGFNPRSTVTWRGARPNTRMGVIALFKNAFEEALSEIEELRSGKKEWKDLKPTTKALLPVIEGRLPLRVHVHKEDDIAILISLAKAYGFKYTIEHACDVHTPQGFRMIKESGAPLVYGPLDSHPYKTELKHESYKNVKLLIENMPELVAIMSDHPVVLQRNLMLQLRFFMMYGMDFAEAVKLITSNSARIVGLNAGEVRVGKLASLVAWNGEPYVMGSRPVLVVAEGEIVREG